ncbi:transcriptional regulator [Gardnerella sp. KA00243]|uniref:transcriptional regulator n=1 Tax=Gardnerella sp. KA00243 TaxID=2749072 RepID=UPI003BA88C23
MKKEILQNLANEVKICRRYALNAVKKAEEGKISSAISMLDVAQTAKTCASKAHEELWKVSGGKLNDTEFELFADAETLDKDIQKAYQAIQQARS